ncbi:MAG: hypothetical protein EOO85_12320 [Pedobacter sp.]|nr:MAG: hypothetical protein EOO85_12320 [Pedobacter sp.]
MRQSLLLLITIFVLSLTSCRNDFEFEPSTGGLEFSRDTVYLDTVFTNIGSSTYTLKVYNRSDKDIAIPTLKLKKGEQSNYRLMVDGMPGKVFNNVELMAKDSMFIFIETTVNIAQANPDDFLYTDEIEFYSSNGIQNVNLVTLVQDAIFLYPERNEEGVIESLPVNEGNEEVRLRGFNLDPTQNNNELHWTNTKPYVIYGYATVPSGQTLTVDPGARVHFHADSGLMVRPGAQLQINGTDSADGETTNEVIFEGDRLEPGFAETPGQWGTVWLRGGSTSNITNLTIKNAVVGILADGAPANAQPVVALNNVQIYNSSNSGILARNSVINAQNIAINKSGVASLALTAGGTYNFKYSTIANYINSRRKENITLQVLSYMIIMKFWI